LFGGDVEAIECHARAPRRSSGQRQAQRRSAIGHDRHPILNRVNRVGMMASLSWSLTAWSALMLPVSPRHAAKHAAEKRTLLRMEFATFCAATHFGVKPQDLGELSCTSGRLGSSLRASAK
jgi:hypothetical protein